jgi:outer membrane protein assembly factor BamB
MRNSKTYFLLLGALLFVACGPVKTTLSPEWTIKHDKHDNIHNMLTALYPVPEKQAIVLTNPQGVEVYSMLNGVSLIEKQKAKSTFRMPSFKKGKESPLIYLTKVVYMYIPDGGYLLEFDYQTVVETITLYDIRTNQKIWQNSDITWSLERMQELTQMAAGLATKSLGVRAGVGAASGIFFPEKFIEDAIIRMPVSGKLLIKDYQNFSKGISCLDLNTGEVLWRTKGISKNIADILVDPSEEFAIIYGGDPPILEGLGHLAQMNKDLAKLDLKTGEILWQSKYDRNFITRLPGNVGNVSFDRFADLRLGDDFIFSNFNQIEVHDLATGASRFVTSTGKDAMMNWTNFGPNVFFPLPIIADGILYRTVTNRILAFNQTFIVEAYDMATGNLLWVSEEISKKEPANMELSGNTLIVGFAGKAGVVALNKQDGKQLWDYSMGKRANSAPMVIHGQFVLVPENQMIHVLNITTGALETTISLKSETGFIRDNFIYDNKLVVMGKKKGIALVSLDNWEVLHQHTLKFEGNLSAEGNQFVISGSLPSDPVVMLDAGNLKELGSIKRAKKRYAITWDSDERSIYEARGGRLIKYSRKS